MGIKSFVTYWKFLLADTHRRREINFLSNYHILKQLNRSIHRHSTYYILQYCLTQKITILNLSINNIVAGDVSDLMDILQNNTETFILKFNYYFCSIPLDLLRIKSDHVFSFFVSFSQR